MTVVSRDEAHRARGNVVVVDVLRAFTTASVAFANGAESILLAGDTPQAFALHERYPDALLMGEEDGLPIRGFDLTNSPLEVYDHDLRGRTLIHRSTSGTKAAVTVSESADRVFLASLINAKATVAVLSGPGNVQYYVASGWAEERAHFDDGDDDLAAIDFMRSGAAAAPPEEVRQRIIGSGAAAQLLSDGIPQADVLFCASSLAGPAIEVTTLRGPELRVAPAWAA